MKFFRKYFDESEKEEITEETAREKLKGYYKNVDLVLNSMKTGEVSFNTNEARYFVEFPINNL